VESFGYCWKGRNTFPPEEVAKRNGFLTFLNGRLFLCEAELDQDPEAQPRVKLVL
jgi:hypothetical protein